jgi:hypothetical protein
MSFLSILKTIGKDIGIGAQFAAPILSLVPGVGTIAGTILNAVVAAEQLITGSGQGVAKSAAVTTIVNAVHPGLNQTDLQNTVNAIVGALNALDTALTKVPGQVTT